MLTQDGSRCGWCWRLTPPSRSARCQAVYQVTQLRNHVLAGTMLVLLGAAVVAVLTIGVRRTLRSADFEPGAQEPRSRSKDEPVPAR